MTRTTMELELIGNVDNWIEDRLGNREPLMVNAFFEFMVALGFHITVAERKRLRKSMRRRYERAKRF